MDTSDTRKLNVRSEIHGWHLAEKDKGNLKNFDTYRMVGCGARDIIKIGVLKKSANLQVSLRVHPLRQYSGQPVLE